MLLEIMKSIEEKNLCIQKKYDYFSFKSIKDIRNDTEIERIIRYK